MNKPTEPSNFAFPYHDPADTWLEEGLTKREYFAAMAMQGILARGSFSRGFVAKHAVDYADALIDALNGKNND